MLSLNLTAQVFDDEVRIYHPSGEYYSINKSNGYAEGLQKIILTWLQEHASSVRLQIEQLKTGTKNDNNT